ncbi:transglutaminase family protein [Williamsia deligens]|uniref:Transglutaminase N-terminal domain-containing protein n=1 Tax=Williamsia deligens TaxID=321325 RepID=A0ABW3GC22_9NOCA|nr:transglutaminase family protein [Williamsia deligens]
MTHRTTYDYDAVVGASFGRCHLLPRDMPGQRVLRSAVTVDPEPADRSTGVDVFGNADTYFHVRTPHRRLEVTGTSLVEVDPIPPDLVERGVALDPWEDHRPGATRHPRSVVYVLDLTPPEITEAVHEYAEGVLTPGRPLIDVVRDLTTRINTDFTYRSGSTAVSTRVDTVMARREGVCQDFARVAVACLRSRGLAARYVSGYLATEPPPGRERVVGADASHAWAAVGTSDGRWIAFDPTNDTLVGERHVTVAWGRDYDDVPPLRGVIYTDSTSSTISVSVDVAPQPPTPDNRADART